MTFLALLLFLLIVGLPIAWLLAEFQARHPLRIALGVLALLSSFGFGYIVSGIASEFEHNAWYGGATGDLIRTTVEQVEDGQLDRVMKVLRGLDRQYQPTYENRANYLELVNEATERMRGDIEIAEGSDWDTAPFECAKWNGLWRNSSGLYDITGCGDGRQLCVARLDRERSEATSVKLSDDCRVLSFEEETGLRHTLRLLNKYEVEQEWFDLEKNAVWKTERLYKLIRASQAQRSMTRLDTAAGE